MTQAQLCLLSDLAAQLPAGWQARADRDAPVLHVRGDVRGPALPLEALPAWLRGAGIDLPAQESRDAAAVAARSVLVFIDGNLHVDGALTTPPREGESTSPLPQLFVTGQLHAGSAVLSGAQVGVQGALMVHDLLWGGPEGALDVGGRLQARVALFTGSYGARVQGPETVEWLLDGARDRPSLAEFSSELAAAVFLPAFAACNGTGGDTLDAVIDQAAVVRALREGQPVTRDTPGIQATFPLALDLCPGGALSAENLLAVLRSPVIAHKALQASGWFRQTDFLLCRQHVDSDGDARDDSVYITVWKTWDFYLAVEPLPRPRGCLGRLADRVLRRPPPLTRRVLTLIYRPWHEGAPGPWAALDAQAPSEAHAACAKAWRGVLDYARKAAGQHRAHYPLQAQLHAEASAQRLEALTLHPVLAERCSDWWDSERNGLWLGNVWVGVRQPCMHDGQPWGRALKLSWKNGADAPGDAPDTAHSAYQMDVDEARAGPAVVAWSYSQRQSEERVPLPPGAADHIARLLRFYRWVQAQLPASNAAADPVTYHGLTAPPRGQNPRRPHGQR